MAASRASIGIAPSRGQPGPHRTRVARARRCPAERSQRSGLSGPNYRMRWFPRSRCVGCTVARVGRAAGVGLAYTIDTTNESSRSAPARPKSVESCLIPQSLRTRVDTPRTQRRRPATPVSHDTCARRAARARVSPCEATRSRLTSSEPPAVQSGVAADACRSHRPPTPNHDRPLFAHARQEPAQPLHSSALSVFHSDSAEGTYGSVASEAVTRSTSSFLPPVSFSSRP